MGRGQIRRERSFLSPPRVWPPWSWLAASPSSPGESPGVMSSGCSRVLATQGCPLQDLSLTRKVGVTSCRFLLTTRPNTAAWGSLCHQAVPSHGLAPCGCPEDLVSQRKAMLHALASPDLPKEATCHDRPPPPLQTWARGPSAVNRSLFASVWGVSPQLCPCSDHPHPPL